MTFWDSYPSTYREKEVQVILTAVQAGECVSVIGLSGAGKSNLLGFLAHRATWDGTFVLIDCNRLTDPTLEGFYNLAHQTLSRSLQFNSDLPSYSDSFFALESKIQQTLEVNPSGLCLLLDRFDIFSEENCLTISSNLRSLRDTHKYQLTYVTATRRQLPLNTELTELVFANTFWLGPLSEGDVHWNVTRYAARKGLDWKEDIFHKMSHLSGGYPSLLRAILEAHSLGCPLELDKLRAHPAVLRRIDEFWADEPTDDMVRESGLDGHPLLFKTRALEPEPSSFTAKEQLLFDYFQSHPNEVCAKDAIIQSVWSEDQIFEQGVRDDSLAQLVRRLRKKIEPDPSNPTVIRTVPGRGYLFKS